MRFLEGKIRAGSAGRTVAEERSAILVAVEAAAMASGSGAGPRLVGISEMLGVDV